MLGRPPDFVVIGGWARSGKDTAADALKGRFGFTSVSLGPIVAELLAKLDPCVGVYDDHYPQVSELLETFGYEGSKANVPDFMRLMQQMCLVVRDEDPEFLAKAAMNRIRPARSKGQRIMVIGLRDPAEVAYFRKQGALTIWIERPGVRPLNNHPAETCANPADYDLVIVNDGTIEDLQAKVIKQVSREEFVGEQAPDW